MAKLFKKKYADGGPAKKKAPVKDTGPIDAGVDPKLLNETIFGKDRNKMSMETFVKKVGASDAKMKAKAASSPKKMGGKVTKMVTKKVTKKK